MADSEIDYAAVYVQLPMSVLLLTPDFVVVDANQSYLDATRRTRDELIGRDVFEAFPDNPADRHATGVQNSKASLRRVLATGKRDVNSFQRYDVEVEGSPGKYESRYWNSVNAPVFGPDGKIIMISHHLEDITEHVRRFMDGLKNEPVAEGSELVRPRAVASPVNP
jgi:PAS domain-containing protein